MSTPPPKHSTSRSVVSRLGSFAAAQAVRKAAVAAGSATVSVIGWPVILTVLAALILAAIVLVVGVIAAASRVSDQKSEFSYQCQSRLGMSVGNTASATVLPRLATSVVLDTPVPVTTWETTPLQPATTTAPTTTTTTAPATSTTTSTTPTATSTNPYANLTVPSTADEKTAACIRAVKSGPIVAQPVHEQGTATGQLAAAYANQQVSLTATQDDGGLMGSTNNAFSAANLARYAWSQASGGRVILPAHVAEQITVGDRVDVDSISAGDLVFFNFTPADGPTSVMIAISPTLGVDATILNQPIAVSVLPSGNVIVKRPQLPVEKATTP